MNRIKELRLAAKLSQAELGEKLGCVSQTVSKLELETRQLDPSAIYALCDFFDCTADYLLGRSSFRYPSVTEKQATMLRAYENAIPDIQRAVDGLLAPYAEIVEKKNA